MLFVFTLGRLSSWRLLFLRKRWVNDDSSAIEEQTLKLNYNEQLAEYVSEKIRTGICKFLTEKMWPGWCCCCWGPTLWGLWGGPQHPAQRWECCCTPSGVSPVNSNSSHSYAATTSVTEVRVLLHAFRCVTCQQQQHSYVYKHSHHIRYRGESVVAMVTIPRRTLWSCRTWRSLRLTSPKRSCGFHVPYICICRGTSGLLHLEEGSGLPVPGCRLHAPQGKANFPVPGGRLTHGLPILIKKRIKLSSYIRKFIGIGCKVVHD